jgi:MFS family permease
VAGVLVQLVTAPFAIAADALSFLASALFLGRIRPAEPAPEARTKGSVTAGARYIARSPILRASLCAVATINFFNLMVLTLFVLYAVRDLHVRPGTLGLVLGAGAVGGVLGAAITKRLAAAIGVGWAYILGCVLFTAPLLLVPLAGGPKPLVLGLLFTAEFVAGFGVMVLDISIGSIFAAVIPDELRARVTGAFQAVNYGTRPAGALAAGGLGTLIGLRPTLWLAAGAGTLGFLWLLPSPLPGYRMPTGAEQRAAEQPAGPQPAETGGRAGPAGHD